MKKNVRKYELFFLSNLLVCILAGCTHTPDGMFSAKQMRDYRIQHLGDGMSSLEGWYNHGIDFQILKRREELDKDWETGFEKVECFSGRLTVKLYEDTSYNQLAFLNRKYVRVTGHIAQPIAFYDEQDNSFAHNGNDVCDSGFIIQALSIETTLPE